MKKLFLTAMIFATTAIYGQQYNFSAKDSELKWQGSKVVGSAHLGTLKIKNGSLTLNKNEPAAAEVTVDMKSIVNTDLKDANWNKKLVNHLNSDDFFATAKFPEAKIAVKNFLKQKDGSYKLKADLTIKGITKSVELNGSMVNQKGSVSAITAQLEFDRTDFNVRYGSGKFFDNLGDKMISDKVKVDVHLQLEKPFKLASNIK